MNIFICYTLRDGQLTEKILRNIYEYLSRYGRVFIDLLDNNADDRQGKVIDELIKCDWIVVIETEGTYDSEWVRLEIDLSRKLEKKMLCINLDEFMLSIQNQLDIFTQASK